MASAVAQIDERLAAEEASPLSAEEQKFADAALAGLTEEQRAKLSPIDIITVVRGYQTYEPRLEETNKALKVSKRGGSRPRDTTDDYLGVGLSVVADLWWADDRGLARQSRL
jgi:hypothetical protein